MSLNASYQKAKKKKKKKIGVLTVGRPSLFFAADPSTFSRCTGEKKKKF